MLFCFNASAALCKSVVINFEFILGAKVNPS
jgi:hypothetical protein